MLKCSRCASSPAIRNLVRTVHGAEFGIKTRASKGNIVSKHGVEKIVRAPEDHDAEAGA